eukprot:CAMPEP_0194183218 /NCGR_PEP_ID=MMETSP0154-20130528/30435_1 /TAXON_ID=1049557 /ORGANISM="Thalassiothrix antarctica, Strain L6-D1" /LENGTH=515 /DNA_ID=CAMNT_0038900065 /DNA_START=130 /DNA_END=1673 /DNA_ORIENTATION=-
MPSRPVPLDPSPVSSAFAYVSDCPLDRLRLSSTEQQIIYDADENPLDYTLAKQEDAAEYIRILFKILGEASIRLESSKVSQFTGGELLKEEALKLIHSDSMGYMSHYSLTRIYEIITSLHEKKPGSAISMYTTFFQPFDGCLMEDYRPLMRVLHLGGRGDPFAQKTASLCLAYILMTGCPSVVRRQKPLFWINSVSIEEPLQALVSWLISQLQSSSAASLLLATSTVSILATSPEARDLLHRGSGIGYITKHLKVRSNSTNQVSRIGPSVGANVQQLYELCFCLWTLTYELDSSPMIRTNFKRSGAVTALVGLLSSAPREKITRVSLSALRNLATCSGDLVPSRGKKIDGSVFLTDMIGSGLLKSITVLRVRQWTDPDLLDDLNTLEKLLHKNFKERTTWDVYQAELESGCLVWGPVHTEKFFRENFKKMEGPDANFEPLKTLVFLATCGNEDQVAIACFDLGEFVRHYPNGRSIATRLGAKEIIMKLIEHENADVQQQALNAMSKVLINNWESV